MNILVGDVESIVQWLDGGKVDGSPYNPGNQLVSAGIVPIIDGSIGEPKYWFFHHDEFTGSAADSKKELQEWLDWADVFVAHNAKFDLQWLIESGFNVPERAYCTHVGEYIFARGRKDIGLSLEDTCIRLDLPRKKSDLTRDYWDKGIGFESMPIEVVREYGIQDVISAAYLYLSQQKRLKEEENSSLQATFDMSMEFMVELAHTQRNGIAIDMAALDEVETAYRAEQATLQERLKQITHEVMGDTPINLGSPSQLSQLVYSREIVNKTGWIETFNIGKNDRNKDLPRPKMSVTQFDRAIRDHTVVMRRTVASQCSSCSGAGRYFRKKKDGTPFSKPSYCGVCSGSGFVYTPTRTVAGLKMLPQGVDDVRRDGFATDSESLEKLKQIADIDGNALASEFLAAMIRLNALDTYISNFCMGIRSAVRADGILHPNFNQTVTSTARLSSSQPNFQNLPRGSTAPIRRVIVSRWKGGKILEGDFSGLEFRVAGELSGDEQIFADVLSGKDVHKQTASIIFQKSMDTIHKRERQEAKPYTFAPIKLVA